jgi:hypothetical protein
MTAATDGSATIDMGGDFPSGRQMQAAMMPQAPLASGRATPRQGRPGANERPAQVFAMSQCSYTTMANGLRLIGCDSFRIACHRRRTGAVTI